MEVHSLKQTHLGGFYAWRPVERWARRAVGGVHPNGATVALFPGDCEGKSKVGRGRQGSRKAVAGNGQPHV